MQNEKMKAGALAGIRVIDASRVLGGRSAARSWAIMARM